METTGAHQSWGLYLLYLLQLNFKNCTDVCLCVSIHSMFVDAWTVFAWVNERNDPSVYSTVILVFSLMNVDRHRCFFWHKDKFALLCIRWLIHSLHEQRAGKKWCSALWLRQAKTWALPLTPSDHAGQKYSPKSVTKIYLLIISSMCCSTTSAPCWQNAVTD